jgi:hypothetical protein
LIWKHLLPLIQRLLEKRPKAYSPENTPGRFALSGELDKMPITELLQLFSLNSKTGKLILKSQGQQGYIYFQTGNIINAQLNKLSGTKALYRLLGIEEGDFCV